MSISFEPGAPTPEGFIPLCVPEIRGNEWKYIKECLDTNFVSSVGPFVDRFERTVADYVDTEYGIATVNGTAALHMALMVAGVQPNDEVLVSTLTFISPVNAIRYVGAWPVFMDAEPEYWQMDPTKVIDFLERECRWSRGELRNKATGRRVKAILPVHILGHPVNIDPILEVAHKYDLVVVEDAAESLGAKYKGRMVGHLGDIACLSFNGNKIITTGGGGMVVTDNEEWADRARYLTTQAKDDPIEYVHCSIGYNYRLTNIQAAMGCAQMELLDYYVQSKRKIAAKYAKALTSIKGLIPMNEAEWAFSTFWLYTVLVDELVYGINSRTLLQRLSRQRIQSRPLWQPIHMSAIYSGSQTHRIEAVNKIHKMGLSIPSSVGLKDYEQNSVINELARGKNLNCQNLYKVSRIDLQ